MTASLETAILDLVAQHGKAAVKQVTLRLTKEKKRDRQLEADFARLAPILEIEARNWLDNKPRMSNVVIAKKLAKEIPGHGEDSTVRRLLLRLSIKNPERIFRQWVLEFSICEGKYPAKIFLKVLQRGMKIPKARDFAKQAGDLLHSDLRYFEKYGMPVEDWMTRRDIRDQVGKPIPLASLLRVGEPRPGLVSSDAKLSVRIMSPNRENNSED
jgi:hypothetical protein